MNAKTLFETAKKEMRPEEISVSDWHSDLYLKVTPISTKLINEYDFKENVTRFRDEIDHEMWFEIPWANTDWWEKHHCYCGENENNKNPQKRFTVSIEETVTQDFTVEVSSFSEALTIASEKYNSGEFVVNSCDCIFRQIRATDGKGESTDWEEF